MKSIIFVTCCKNTLPSLAEAGFWDLQRLNVYKPAIMTTITYGQQKLILSHMHRKLYSYGRLTTLGLCITLLTGPYACAQNAEGEPLGNSPLGNLSLDDLYACRALEPVTARSDCYDRATTALLAAENRGAVIVLRSDEFKKIQEGVFGYNYVPGKDLDNSTQTNTLEIMTTPVKKVERYLSGYVITLDNNQVWEQFAGSISRVPKGKLSAEIKTTPTGTYKMVLFNAKSRVSNIKVRRIQ